MRDRHYSASSFYRHLSTEDKKALRSVSKGYREEVKLYQQTPYTTKIDFMLGVSGLFHHQDYFNVAWTIYHHTLTSTSSKPAMLYKAKDIEAMKKRGDFRSFAEGEHARREGRIYSPGDKHAMSVNLAWLLAQTHIARPFLLYSNFEKENIMREDKPTFLSAFMIEIMVAIKAGYSVDIRLKDQRILLNPSEDKEMKQLALPDLKLTKEDVAIACQRLLDCKSDFEEAQSTRREFEAMHSEILGCHSLAKLKQFEIVLQKKVANFIDKLFAEGDEKRRYVFFVKEMNDSLSKLNHPSFFSQATPRFFGGKIKTHQLKKRTQDFLSNQLLLQLAELQTERQTPRMRRHANQESID
jgi:hypothetical protein